MYVKIHRSYRNVVAVCDKSLMNKKFEEGKRQLEIKEHFFKGSELSEEEAIKLMQQQFKEDATFNIVGEKSISAAIKAGLIKKDSAAYIQNIPFALILV